MLIILCTCYYEIAYPCEGYGPHPEMCLCQWSIKQVQRFDPACAKQIYVFIRQNLHGHAQGNLKLYTKPILQVSLTSETKPYGPQAEIEQPRLSRRLMRSTRQTPHQTRTKTDTETKHHEQDQTSGLQPKQKAKSNIKPNTQPNNRTN